MPPMAESIPFAAWKDACRSSGHCLCLFFLLLRFRNTLINYGTNLKFFEIRGRKDSTGYLKFRLHVVVDRLATLKADYSFNC